MIQEFIVEEEYDGERIDKVLAQIYTDQSRSFFQKLIRTEKVKVGERVVTKTGATVDYGDLIRVDIPQAQSVAIEAEDIPLDILYEDADLLIVNKPKGMVVHPSAGHLTGTLVNAIMYHCADSLSGINGEIRPGIVHRIDMDTTGSLIVCKNDTAHVDIAQQIRDHSVNRIYRGIVCGNLKEDEGTIQGDIGRHPTQRKKMAVVSRNGKPAITHYQVLARFGKYTYAQFRLETGRTHQIRVHLSSIGHPLLGDELYGGVGKVYGKKGLCGQCLHAMTIGLIHPTTREYLEVSAPLPDYFQELLKKLQGEA